MVDHAEYYEWSSYRQHAGLEQNYWIDNDPAYMGSADDKEELRQRYQDYVNQPGSENESQLIQKALQRGQLTGTSRFVEYVKRRLGLRIEHRGLGRPKRTV